MNRLNEIEARARKGALMHDIGPTSDREWALCATAIREDVPAIRDALVRQLYLPVQWTDCVQALASRGVTRIGECGPGKVLTGLIKRIDKALDARPLGTPAELAGALDDWR